MMEEDYRDQYARIITFTEGRIQMGFISFIKWVLLVWGCKS